MVSEIVVGGDIGGTNARLQTLSSNGEFTHSITYPRDKFSGPLEVMKQYEKDVGGKITVASLAVAGVIMPGTDTIYMGNGWTFSMNDLRREFGDVRAMNDFTPVAYAVIDAAQNPERANVVQMGGGKPLNGGLILVGPGTGLGGAIIDRVGDSFHASESEVSAITIDHFKHIPTPKEYARMREQAKIDSDERQHMILKLVAAFKKDESFGHVSSERLISGPGLQNLYNAVCILNDEEWRAGTKTPADISKAALGKNPEADAREALDLMMHFMGQVMSTLVMSIKATGGAYIASHIINKIMDADPDYIANSPLRAAFEAKGRVTPYVKEIPIFILRSKEPAFDGLKIDLQRHLSL